LTDSRPLRPDLGQLRIFLDLDPPTLIVRQMPVKLIKFVLRHQVDVLLDEFDREEVSADIEMHASVIEAVSVLYLNHRNRNLTCSDDGKQLTECLNCIEQASGIGSVQMNTILFNLGSVIIVAFHKDDIIAC
jgi:hypothetical protein